MYQFSHLKLRFMNQRNDIQVRRDEQISWKNYSVKAKCSAETKFWNWTSSSIFFSSTLMNLLKSIYYTDFMDLLSKSIRVSQNVQTGKLMLATSFSG